MSSRTINNFCLDFFCQNELIDNICLKCSSLCLFSIDFFQFLCTLQSYHFYTEHITLSIVNTFTTCVHSPKLVEMKKCIISLL